MQSVFCCGGNAFYQLGLGDYEDRYKLISLNELIYSQIPPKDKINKIFSGNEHTFILTKQHSILVCGENEYGQLGLGDFKDRTHFEHFNFFKQEQFTNNKEFIIEIFCGNGHTLFLTNKGMVYGCGWNFFGQLGIRFGKNSTNVPIKLNIENIKKITGGNEYSIFITKDYKIYVSGYNKGGNLGTGNNLNQYTLHNIPFFNNLENEHVIDVACGAEQTFFLTNLGNVFACGQNYHLQLGILNKSSFSVPTKLNIENVKNVYCGSFHTLFLLKGNELYGCGANSYGQLGINKEEDECALRKINLDLKENEYIRNIICGASHTIIITYQDHLKCFGDNSFGQLSFKESEMGKEKVKSFELFGSGNSVFILLENKSNLKHIFVKQYTDISFLF